MNSDSHKKSSVEDCRLIDFKSVCRENGNLVVAENRATAPFDIRRVYYVYDVPAGAERGGHSHYATSEMAIALSGSFDVVIDDGHMTRRIALNSPGNGLLLAPGIWRTLENFSAGAICLVLASEKFDEADYVRDYDEFKKLTATKE